MVDVLPARVAGVAIAATGPVLAYVPSRSTAAGSDEQGSDADRVEGHPSEQYGVNDP